MYVFKDDRDFVLKTRELLLKQGAKSSSIAQSSTGSSFGMCMYRHEGKGCGVGIHLEDECYDKDMEGYSIGGIVNREVGPFVDPIYAPLINNLRTKFFNVKLKTMIAVQSIHDANEVGGWTIAFDGLLERLDDK